jgi:hypothetical protein
MTAVGVLFALLAALVAPASASVLGGSLRQRWRGVLRREPPQNDEAMACFKEAIAARRAGGGGCGGTCQLTAFQVTEPTFRASAEALSDNLGQPYLLQFRGKGDDYCREMEPLKKQLRAECGCNIRVFEVWYDTTNLELLQRLDRGRCGGVPFFYNKRTRRFICGATTYENLKNWALSEPCEPFLPPPNLLKDKEPEQNRLQKGFSFLKAKAAEKIAERQGDAPPPSR